MRHKMSLPRLACVLALLLAGAAAREAHAQTPLQQCEERVKLLTELSNTRRDRVANLEQQVQLHEERARATQEKIDLLNTQMAELRKQIETQEKDKELLRDSLTREQNIAQGRQEMITLQNTVISKLVEGGGRRSTWQKVIETLPSVAGIVALAIAR